MATIWLVCVLLVAVFSGPADTQPADLVCEHYPRYPIDAESIGQWPPASLQTRTLTEVKVRIPQPAGSKETAGCGFFDLLPQLLAEMPQLEYLELQGTLAFLEPEVMQQLTLVHTVCVEADVLHTEDLRRLQHLPALQNLRLRCPDFVGDLGELAACRCLGNLQLERTECVPARKPCGSSDRRLVSQLSEVSQLTGIAVSSDDQWTADDVSAIGNSLQQLPNLRELRVDASQLHRMRRLLPRVLVVPLRTPHLMNLVFIFLECLVLASMVSMFLRHSLSLPQGLLLPGFEQAHRKVAIICWTAIAAVLTLSTVACGIPWSVSSVLVTGVILLTAVFCGFPEPDSARSRGWTGSGFLAGWSALLTILYVNRPDVQSVSLNCWLTGGMPGTTVLLALVAVATAWRLNRGLVSSYRERTEQGLSPVLLGAAANVSNESAVQTASQTETQRRHWSRRLAACVSARTKYPTEQPRWRAVLHLWQLGLDRDATLSLATLKSLVSGVVFVILWIAFPHIMAPANDLNFSDELVTWLSMFASFVSPAFLLPVCLVAAAKRVLPRRPMLRRELLLPVSRKRWARLCLADMMWQTLPVCLIATGILIVERITTSSPCTAAWLVRSGGGMLASVVIGVSLAGVLFSVPQNSRWVVWTVLPFAAVIMYGVMAAVVYGEPRSQPRNWSLLTSIVMTGGGFLVGFIGLLWAHHRLMTMEAAT